MKKNAIKLLATICEQNVILAKAIETAYEKTEEIDSVVGTPRPEGDYYDKVVMKALGLKCILEEEVKKVITEEEWIDLCTAEVMIGKELAEEDDSFELGKVDLPY